MKILRTKIFVGQSGWKNIGTSSHRVWNCKYCIYLFGFLLKCIDMDEVDGKQAETMFKGKEIIWPDVQL